MVVCSQKVFEIGSIWVSFWKSKALLNRFLRGAKNTRKTQSFVGGFWVPKRAPKSCRNRSFFDVVSGTLFWMVSKSILSRFRVDLGIIFGHNSYEIKTQMWDKRGSFSLMFSVTCLHVSDVMLWPKIQKCREGERERGRGREREGERSAAERVPFL